MRQAAANALVQSAVPTQDLAQVGEDGHQHSLQESISQGCSAEVAHHQQLTGLAQPEPSQAGAFLDTDPNDCTPASVSDSSSFVPQPVQSLSRTTTSVSDA